MMDPAANLLPSEVMAEGGVESLMAYRNRGGWLALGEARRLGAREVRARVEAAGLRGRGGAGFAAARKWTLAAEAAGETKYVVANGGEHEPGSRKDRVLVSRRPHLVLEGMAVAALATGARKGYLYLIEDMSDARAAAEAAIAEARTAGFLGGDAADGFDVEVVAAPPTYVAGEETAALEVIEGRKPWPRKKPPYPGQAGLWGRPTTVNNVETLAAVPSIVRGLPGAGSTMLFTLDERVHRPGVHERRLGSTFRELIYEAGGGPRSGRAIRAVLPALSSAFLPASALDLPMTFEAVKEAGSNLGCGGVSFIEEGESVVARLVEITAFFMREQCGQCPPCRMETNTLAAVVKQAAAGQGGGHGAQIEKITSFARGKGNCSLIEMAAAPVLSALRLFPEAFPRVEGPGA